MTRPGLSRLQANALLLLTALIWGSAFVAQVWGMAGVGPLTFTAARFALGALVVAPLAWWEWRQLQHRGQAPGRAALGPVALLGTLLCAGVAMQQIGLQTTSVTNAGFLTALYVPLVPLLAWAWQRQRPGWGVALAMPLCVAGTALLTGAQGWQSLQPGDLWMLGCAAACALHVLLVGQVANRLQGAFVLSCGQFLVCALVSGLLALATEPVSARGLVDAAAAIAYTGVLSVGVAFTLQVVGQRHAPPADAAIVLSAETVFAALFGAWLMGDRLGPAGLAGCGLILGGILLVQCWPRVAQRLRQPSTEPA